MKNGEIFLMDLNYYKNKKLNKKVKFNNVTKNLDLLPTGFGGRGSRSFRIFQRSDTEC